MQQRVSEVTGVGLRTFRRTITEGEKHEGQGTAFNTPGKNHNGRKPVIDLFVVDS